MAQANIKAVITAEDRASRTLGGFSNSIEGLSDKIVKSAKVAAAALAAASAAAITFGVKSAAEFQQTRVGIENMLGSAEKAKTLLGDISKFAAETPFEFPELAQATRQLIAFGFSAEDAFDTMKQLGDVSAAIGAPMNDIAYLMGTLRVQGRAFMIDIRQFAQRGIPIYEYLGIVLGKTTGQIAEMIEQGKIGFPEVQQAFKAMTAEGGKFHNTMEKQSKTLNGRISTLKDNFGILLRNLVGINEQGDVTAGGVFDRISRVVERLNSFLGENKENIMAVGEAFRQYIGQVAVVAVEKLTAAWRFLGQAWEWIKPQLDGLFKSLQENLWPAVRRLWEALEPIAPYIGGVLVGALILAINALTLLVKGFSSVVGAVLDVIDAFKAWSDFSVGVGLAIYNKLLPAFNLIKGAFDGIKDAAVRTWGFIKNLDWGAAIAGIGRSVANSIISLIEKGINAAVNIPGVPDVRLPRFANGVRNFGGGLAVVGERGPEIVRLPRGSDVMPNGSSVGGGVNITIQAGAFMGSQQDARRYAELIMNAYKDLQGSRMQMA